MSKQNRTISLFLLIVLLLFSEQLSAVTYSDKLVSEYPELKEVISKNTQLIDYLNEFETKLPPEVDHNLVSDKVIELVTKYGRGENNELLYSRLNSEILNHRNFYINIEKLDIKNKASFTTGRTDAGDVILDDFKVNSNTNDSDQLKPYINTYGDGNFFIGWDSRESNISYVYTKKYDNNGQSQGDDFLVFTNASYFDYRQRYSEHAICSDKFGNFIVAGDPYDNTENSPHIDTLEAVSYDYNNNIINSFIIMKYSEQEEWKQDIIDPRLSFLPNNNFIASWFEDPDDDNKIKARRFNMQGTPLDNAFTLSEVYCHLNASIASSIDGFHALVTMDSKDEDAIYIHVYDSENISVFTKSIYWLSLDNVNPYIEGFDSPAIAITNDQKIILTMQARSSYTDDWNIYACIFSETGTLLKDYFQVDADFGGHDHYDPHVAVSKTGDFIITWTDYRNGDSDIYAQLFSNDGTKIAENFRVNNDLEPARQWHPQVSIYNNRAYFSWQDERDIDYGWDIYAAVEEFPELLSESISGDMVISGSDEGKVGQTLEFSSSEATSSKGHDVEYQYNWGDGSQSDWSATNTLSHIYLNSGTFNVTIRARCAVHTDIMSDWSDEKQVSVTFCTLTSAVTPLNSGSIVRNPDKENYLFNEAVELLATPHPNYQFDRWTGDVVGNISNTTLLMDGDKNVIAHFALFSTGKQYYAYKIPDNFDVPVIDGVVNEVVWDLVNGETLLGGGIPNIWGQQWTALADNLVTWKAVWSSSTNQLYVAVEVVDDVQSIFDNSDAEQGSFQPWKDDSIEFYTDGDNSGGHYLRRFDIAQQWRVTAQNIRNLASSGSDVYDGADFVTAVTTGENGNWTCEAVFKIYNELPTDPKTLAIDDVIGWNIWYNDSDNETYEDDYFSRDHQTGWEYVGPAYANADYFGEIILKDEQAFIENIFKPTVLTVPESGKVGQNLSFQTSGAVSNLGHEVEYQFDWGDETRSGWGGGTILYSYDEAESYLVKSRARCKTNTNIMSDWSDIKTIVIDYCTLSIDIIPEGAGTVSKNPDIENFYYNDDVELTALPAPGFEFLNWDHDPENISNPITINMNENKDVIANFNRIVRNPVHFIFATSDESYPIVIESTNLENFELELGDEIGVFTPSGLCVGASVWTGYLPLDIAAWKDDPQTPDVVDGYKTGDIMLFRIWDSNSDPSTEYSAASTYTTGNGTFGYQSYSVISKFEIMEQTNQKVVFEIGWSWISLNIQPTFFNVENIFNETTNLEILIDGNGEFYVPESVNSIVNWNPLGGYKLYVSAKDCVETTGEQIVYNTPIFMKNGWNFVSYLPQEPIPADIALNSIITNLEIAKSHDQGFYIPGVINTIEDMKPGAGYKLYVNDATVLLYPDVDHESTEKKTMINKLSDKTKHYQFKKRTNDNYCIVINDITIDNEQLNVGDEIAVLNSDNLCVGAVSYTGKKPVPLVAWADDIRTKAVDGYIANDEMKFVIWDAINKVEYTTNAITTSGDLAFETGSYCHVLSLEATKTGVENFDTQIPTDFALYQNYPNPFNPETKIRYSLPHQANVTVKIYNMQGQLLSELINESQQAGTYNLTWNAVDKQSGIYVCVYQADNYKNSMKLLLVK